MNGKFVVAALIAASVGGWVAFGGAGGGAEAAPLVIPEYSQTAQSGEIAFGKYCVACHGVNGAGTDQGPPFLHAFYKSGHHGDASFANAAMNGVRAHHWRFGDMPAVEGISEAEIRWITKYVRELQAANGF